MTHLQPQEKYQINGVQHTVFTLVHIALVHYQMCKIHGGHVPLTFNKSTTLHYTLHLIR